jgi:hypothetical protein
MSELPPGCIETIAGPPVENANRVAPVSAGVLAAVAPRARDAGLRRRAPLGTDARGAGRSRTERLAEVVEPDAVVGPSPAARGNAALASDRERIGEARVAESDHRVRELHRHLAHLRDLALRRDGDDRDGAGSTDRRSEDEEHERLDETLHHASRCVARV